LSASLNYVDWSGARWIASRAGSRFTSVKADPASTDKVCRANAATGVSAFPPGSTSFSDCISYVSTSIPLTDASGNHVTVSFAPQGLPTFTTPSNLSFVPNIASTKTITAAGMPAPQICVASNNSTPNNLPSDISLNSVTCSANGSLQLAFRGG